MTMTDSALITTLSPARRRIAFYVLLLGALLPALNMFIAREPWFMLTSDAVDVRRRNGCGKTHLCFVGTLKQT